MNARVWIVSGALLAGAGVLAGSFGAHMLPPFLADTALADTVLDDTALDNTVLADAGAEQFVSKRLDQFETAVRYQIYHALALLAVGLLRGRAMSKWLTAAGCCFLVGVVLFSGMLYALVLTDTPRLGMIVPLGGAAFIVGWVLLAIAGWRLREIDAT